MKNIFLSVLFLQIISFQTHGGQDRGGGNTLGGKMIESYIKNPKSLYDGTLLDQRLKLLKEKNIDLYSILEKGLRVPLWYFIPGNLKELSETVTGIPFSSEQTAIQSISTNEIWVDQTSYDSLDLDLNSKSSIEKQKLLAHEALIGGLNSIYFSVDSNLDRMLLDKKSMPEFKKLVRGTIHLLFNPEFESITSKAFFSELKRFGWEIYNDQLICLRKIDTNPDGNRVYKRVRCSDL